MDKPLIAPSPSEIALHKLLVRPLQKSAGMSVTITRYYTDVAGSVIDKSLVPASIQKSFPFWMFGQFDRLGGFRIGNQVAPPNINTPYVGTFVYGLDMPFLFATGLNNIKNNLKIGDLIHIFADSLDAPNYYIWIVQSCSSSGIASIYANAIAPERQKIDIGGINYFAYTNGNPNLQFQQVINLTRIDVLGAWVNKPENALGSLQVDDKQAYFIYVPLEFQVDQYNMVSSFIDFNMDLVRFSFLAKKSTSKV